MKKLSRFLKHFASGIFIILIFNKMAIGLDIFIPLNVFTILIVGFLNIPGLIMLIIIYMSML